jgi:hypothetical protein
VIQLLARFSPRLTALLALPRSINRLITAIEDVIHDQGVAFPTTADPKVQILLNEVKVVRLKLHDIRE